MSGHPVARDDVRVVELDGETVLFDPVAARTVLLNGTASAVWTLLDGSRSVGDIASALATVFEVDVETIIGDVVRTVEQLTESGVLRPDAAS